MKKMLFLFAALTGMLPVFAQSTDFDGSWKKEGNSDTTCILLFQDGYFTFTKYLPAKFINSGGGVFTTPEKSISIRVEFNALNSDETGSVVTLPYSLAGNSLTIRGTTVLSGSYRRIANDAVPLSGVWKITAREQDGKLTDIHQTGPRKTLKMLTGNRFQWFAINPETKQFSGTGGGTYTFRDGKYTENIEFFSRDDQRVGASLSFDGKIENGKWHHSGLSSKGDKIYEVWSRIDQ